MSPVKLTCDNCGGVIERRPSWVHERNFCNNDCRMQHWREKIQPKMAAAGSRVLAELHAEGRDPRHGERQQEARREHIEKINHKRWGKRGGN